MDILKDEVMGLNKKGFIVGPPGTGKSVCTLSFLASLDHEEWNPVWIHLSDFLDYCVILGAKQSWIIPSIEKFELPRVANKKLFVCLDGYRQTEAHKSFLKTKIYTDLHPENERVVVCSSMAALGKRNLEDEANAKIKYFSTYSWTLTEYHDAIANPVFYDKVAAKLDATCISDVNDEDDGQDDLSEDEKKNRGLEYKYYYAGGSCRFMFQYTTGEVIKALKDAVNDAANKANLATCSFGNFHIDFTSKLYDMQSDKSVDGELLPVSSYVLYLFVIKSGMEVIADLAHRLMAESNRPQPTLPPPPPHRPSFLPRPRLHRQARRPGSQTRPCWPQFLPGNPSMDGFYFELLLLVSISQCVVTLHGAKKEEAVHLPKAPILMFDLKKRFRKEEDRKLYSGVITKCHEDDTYDIEYEGGKKVTRGAVELISLPVKEGGCDIKLKVNDEVKARLKPNIKGNQRWLRPMLVDTKCNQGGYDAVYFDMEAGKVIFSPGHSIGHS